MSAQRSASSFVVVMATQFTDTLSVLGKYFTAVGASVIWKPRLSAIFFSSFESRNTMTVI